MDHTHWKHRTKTACGDIAHLVVAGGQRLTVQLETMEAPYHGRTITTLRKDAMDRPYPLLHEGRLVYALPGGGRVVSDRILQQEAA